MYRDKTRTADRRASWNSIHTVAAALLLALLLLMPSALVSPALEASGTQTAAATGAAAAAVKANPELVTALAKQIGSSPEQAAGAAGALFGTAKSSLKPEEFSLVAKSVPGMDSLLKAAPSTGGASGTLGSISKMAGSGGGLAGAASAFKKLGIPPEMVAQAVPVLTSYVTKMGGPKVGNLLAGVLK